jgi:O-antigen ligase
MMPRVASTGRFAIVAYVVFLGVVALTGGSSQYAAASQPIVRLAALLLIGVLVVRPSEPHPAYRPAFWFITALGALILIQLAPLPPSLWNVLPGHERYFAAAVAASEPQPWRPINLTPDRGWNALFALLPPLATLLAASRLQMRDQGVVLLTLILIVTTSAVIGLAQVSAGEDDTLRFYAAPQTGAAVGLFANRNHQALLIACGLPMLGLWAERARADRSKRRLYAACALIGGAFLVLTIPTTGSRAGLALAALALPCTLLLAWPAIRAGLSTLSASYRRLAASVGCVALAALIAAALTFSRAESVRRLFAFDPVEDARVRLLRPLLGMIRDFLPFGSGFGSFDPVYRGFEPFENLAVTFMNQAHDDYLQLILEGGLPGLALLLVFLGWWGWATLRLWRGTVSERVALGRLGSILILLTLLASLTDYPVRTPLIMVIVAQGTGWMLRAVGRQRDHA